MEWDHNSVEWDCNSKEWDHNSVEGVHHSSLVVKFWAIQRYQIVKMKSSSSSCSSRSTKPSTNESQNANILQSQNKPVPLFPKPTYKNLRKTLFFFNARSLLPEFDKFCLLISSLNPDLVCITETWFSSEIPSSEVHLHDYLLFQKDRPHWNDGVAIYIYYVISYSLSIKHFHFYWIPCRLYFPL